MKTRYKVLGISAYLAIGAASTVIAVYVAKILAIKA